MGVRKRTRRQFLASSGLLFSLSGCLRLQAQQGNTTQTSSTTTATESPSTTANETTLADKPTFEKIWGPLNYANELAQVGDRFALLAPNDNLVPLYDSQGEQTWEPASSIPDKYQFALDRTIKADSKIIFGLEGLGQESANHSAVMAYSTGDGTQIFEYQSASDGSHTLITDLAQIGDFLAYSTTSLGNSQENNPNIYILNEDGSEHQALTDFSEISIRSLTDHNGQLIASANNQLFIINPKTGEITNTLEPEFGVGRSSQSEGDLFFGTDHLQRFNPDSGETVWSSEFGNFFRSPPLVDESLVFITVTDGQLIALDKETGDEVWRKRIGYKIQSIPKMGANSVWTVDEVGNLWGFEKDSGNLLKKQAPTSTNRYRDFEVIEDTLAIWEDGSVNGYRIES